MTLFLKESTGLFVLNELQNKWIFFVKETKTTCDFFKKSKFQLNISFNLSREKSLFLFYVIYLNSFDSTLEEEKNWYFLLQIKTGQVQKKF